MNPRLLCATGVFALLSLCVPICYALDKTPVLSLDVARKLVAGCEAKAVEKGWKMNIAIVDTGANLIEFSRMDRSFLGSGDIALRKAQTAARFPFPTRVIEDLSYGKDKKGGSLPGLALVPGMIAFAGGLPVMSGGVPVGAIGVSGGTADEDELCAQAALEAAKKALE
jgi:uncharacterized protein GlcG (DUF336 family)